MVSTKQTKKILFLNANLLPGGAERQMVTVARLLKQRGHQVSFYCYGKGDFYGPLLKEENIPVVWEYSFNNPLKRIVKVRNYIRRGGCDAVISFMSSDNFLNEIASLGGKSWKVITGLRFCPQIKDKSLKDRIYNWFRRYSDIVVCNSQNAINAWFGFRPNSTVDFKLIYNYVYLEPVLSDYIPRKDGKLHIIVAASFQYLKNPLGLAEALVKMSIEVQKNIIVDWYGGGHHSQVFKETESIIAENGLEKVLFLHDATNKIHEKMYESDVVMLLSKQEGLPNAICEGMTLGKPIIMTKVSDYDILVDETNGVLCDANNVDSIKNAIIQMESNSIESLLRMGNCSAQKAQHLFSKDVIVSQWEQLCEN